jgi:hypothetical protein
MAAKVSQITSWVRVHLCHEHNIKGEYPLDQWGSVHTHQGMPTIEGWGSLSHVQSVGEKTKENNQKARKIIEL